MKFLHRKIATNMKSIIENGVDWLWDHKPDIAVIGAMLACAVWVTSTINSFENRIAATERICDDINNRQLPDIRTEIKAIKDDIVGIKEDMIEIKLFMKKIDTYLSTTSEKYPGK